MTELEVPVQIEANKPEVNIAPLKEIDAALKACTFGKFQYRLLFIAFVGYMSGVFVSTSTGYLLPDAECDLQMTLLRKGLLTAMPYIGMLLSSVIAGFLTGAFGRKIFLVVGFVGIFAFTLLSASSQTYEVLVTAKFFEGVFFATSFSSFLAITCELCSNDVRDRVVLVQSSFSVIANILIALISWGTLTNDWKISFFGGKYVLNTWNFYLYAVSLWSLTASILYGLWVPESPKYLVTQNKYDEARDILIKIYVQNTGKPANTCPFTDIWKDRRKQASDDTSENRVANTIKHRIVAGLYEIKPMFRKPLVINLGLICMSNFIVMCMFNVLRLWFPQLSAIIENNQAEDNTNFCRMVNAYTDKIKATQAMRNATLVDVCVPTKSGDETYINNIIVGCTGLVPQLISGILVNKVGKKSLLIVDGIVCMAATIGIQWANTKVAIVLLFSVTTAISKGMISLNQAITLEIFGTSTRALAVSFIMLTGRIGTLTGNVSFPALLNMGCEVPFFVLSGLMVGVIIISLFMPKKKES